MGLRCRPRFLALLGAVLEKGLEPPPSCLEPSDKIPDSKIVSHGDQTWFPGMQSPYVLDFSGIPTQN